MGKKLVWEFEIKDRVTGPVTTETQALRKLKVSLQTTAEATERLATSKEKGAKHAESFATHLHSVWENAEKVAEVGLRAVETVSELGTSFSEAAIEAASFKESTLIGLETVMGSAKDAQKVFQDAVRLSYNLPIEPKAAVEMANQLALSGVPKEDLNHLVVAASDVGALNPGRSDEAMRLFLRQVADVQSAGGLNASHLRFLSQETHIPKDLIIKNLERFSGLKAPQGEDERALGAFLKAIPRDTALTAIAQAIADVQGGKLGTVSERKSKSVEGLRKRLEGRPHELLMDLDTAPAYKEFRGFLSNAVKLTDPSSAFGSKIKSTLANIFGGTFHRIFGDFSGDAGMKNLQQVLDQVLHGVDLVGAGFQTAAGFAVGFVEGLTGVGSAAGGLFGKDGKLDQKKIDEFADAFKAFGRDIGQAAAELGKLAIAAAELAKTPLLKAIRGDYGSELAGWLIDKTQPKMGEGYMMGLDIKGPRGGAISPFSQLPKPEARVLAGVPVSAGVEVSPVNPIRPPGADEIDRIAGARTGAGQGGRAVTVHGGDVNVTVHAPGATRETARDIGAELERVVPTAVARANRSPSLSSDSVSPVTPLKP